MSKAVYSTFPNAGGDVGPSEESARRQRGKWLCAATALGLWAVSLGTTVFDARRRPVRRNQFGKRLRKKDGPRDAQDAARLEREAWLTPKVHRWGEGSGSRFVDEHRVGQGFAAQTWLYWRHVVAKDVNVTSYRYKSVDGLFEAVNKKKLKAHSVVFIDVRFEALDTLWQAPQGAKLDVAHHRDDALARRLRRRALEAEEGGGGGGGGGGSGEDDVVTEAAEVEEEVEEASDVDASDVDDAVVAEDAVVVDPPSEVHRNKWTFDEHFLDPTCVYDFTPSLFLRSRLLRAVWRYEEPLTVMIAGDVACRIKSLPPTHHNVIFSGDANAAQVGRFGGDSKARWWPQGLEGVSFSDAKDAPTLTQAEAIPVTDRLFLFHDSISVNARKPSRARLVKWLAEGKGESELVALARAANLSVSFHSTVSHGASPHKEAYDFLAEASLASMADSALFQSATSVSDAVDLLATARYNNDPLRAAVASSVFALCPAGDVWSSGRIVNAMLLGAIPVVDVTYQKDPDSAKGCSDPARFWREGGDGFQFKAPFVFVDDWARLPQLLDEAGANDPVKLQDTVDQIAVYAANLNQHLLNVVLDDQQGEGDDAASASSSSSSSGKKKKNRKSRTGPSQERNAVHCTTEPLSKSETDQYHADVRAYYADPHWYNSAIDLGSTPGATCTARYATEMTTTDLGALCFDPVCAPPLVKSFVCSETPTRPTTTDDKNKPRSQKKH